jgi:hypothetical protein
VPSKQCRVSITDSSGIEHTVTVDADSVYLAAARGLAELRKHGWVDEIPEGLNCLRVVVSESREVTHNVTVKRLQQWAKGSPRSPAEVLRRAEVRRELGVE